MWNLNFISEQDFTDHVKATIEKYGEKLESFDLKRFNKNIIGRGCAGRLRGAGQGAAISAAIKQKKRWRIEVFTVYPSQMTIPAVILAILMLGFNLLGDGLRDALDPTMKEM